MMQGKIHLKIARHFLSFDLFFLDNRYIAIRIAVHSMRNSTHFEQKEHLFVSLEYIKIDNGDDKHDQRPAEPEEQIQSTVFDIYRDRIETSAAFSRSKASVS